MPGKFIFHSRHPRWTLTRLIASQSSFVAFWYQTAVIVTISIITGYRIVTALAEGNPGFSDPDGDTLLSDIGGLIAAGILLPVGSVLVIGHALNRAIANRLLSGESPSRARWWGRFVWIVVLPVTTFAAVFSTWFMYVALENNSECDLYGCKTGAVLEPNAYFYALSSFAGCFILLLAAVTSLATITGLLRRL
jgi:hypothetical protein